MNYKIDTEFTKNSLQTVFVMQEISTVFVDVLNEKLAKLISKKSFAAASYKGVIRLFSVYDFFIYDPTTKTNEIKMLIGLQHSRLPVKVKWQYSMMMPICAPPTSKEIIEKEKLRLWFEDFNTERFIYMLENDPIFEIAAFLKKHPDYSWVYHLYASFMENGWNPFDVSHAFMIALADKIQIGLEEYLELPFEDYKDFLSVNGDQSKCLKLENNSGIINPVSIFVKEASFYGQLKFSTAEDTSELIKSTNVTGDELEIEFIGFDFKLMRKSISKNLS